jgi:predicted secreted Zn-dependent protease
LKHYLSGAITRQPYFKAYFKYYEDELRHWGISDIFNPASVDWPGGVEWETCMKYDLKVLVDCDVLVLLPNWRKSRGAKLEIHVAKALGIRVVKMHDLLREAVINAF